MTTINFISPKYVKDSTTIQQNVDDNIILPYIQRVQDIHLQQALGTDFFNHLKEQVKSSSLTNDEEDLLRMYVQPMLSEWTFYEVMPHLNYKFTNKAASKESSEFSQPSSLTELKYLRQSVRDMAEFYTERLNKYLCANSELFPEYVQTGQNLNPNKKSYFSGIYIPGKNKCNNC